MNGRRWLKALPEGTPKYATLDVEGSVREYAMLLSLLLALQVPAGGTPVINPAATLTTTVGGLEATDATASIVDVANRPWKKALRVQIRRTSAETNATQLTLSTTASIKDGDTLLATFWARGNSGAGGLSHIEFLFEKTTNPWTKSVIFDASPNSDWRCFQVAFSAAQSYAPGEAMASFRFAFGPQLIDLGPVDVSDFGTSRTVESLTEAILEDNPIGPVTVKFDPGKPRQTMLGFGGDFCQARYGLTDVLDTVGKYVIDHLDVVHARIGLPLSYWEPRSGEFHDDAQATASFELLALMSKRKIPTAISIWEAPGWLLGGKPEESGRVLPKERYADCIEAIGHYLVVAREKYKAKVDFISFNEPDYGVNFKFTPDTMREFIRQAGKRFAELGLSTKFLVGDTSGGASFAAFATPILSDPTITKYLGPISFHCWDVLGSSDAQYESIRALGRKFNKPVWCLEAGHDSGLWEKQNPWGTWENALRTAMAYEKTLRLSGAELMDYWTYEDNYPIVDKDGIKPYPVFEVIRQLQTVFGRGARVVQATSDAPDLQALGSIDTIGRLSALILNAGGPGKPRVYGFKPNDQLDVFCRTRMGVEHFSGSADADGAIVVAAPLRSVITVVQHIPLSPDVGGPRTVSKPTPVRR